ncbi:hypothetical protein ACEWX4_07695 [Acinetobacter indicus]|uniref:hypothetical protein n=1 Tax=Acinetobacter indicus TaxID=756892 RepID=UPI0035BC39A0
MPASIYSVPESVSGTWERIFRGIGVMDIQRIKELALANGFKLKEQASGNMDLNAYVYDFANAIEREVKAQAVPEWFDYTKQSPQMDGNYQIFIKGEQITAKWVSRFGFADPIEGDALRQELITHWAMQPQSPKAQEPTND